MKQRKQLSIEEEALERFQIFADQTNRSISELMIEATEQMIRRYSKEKLNSLAEQITALQEKLEEMYQYVPK